MGHHGVTAGLQLSHVTAADGTAEYQSRFTCCLLSCFLLYRYQIPPRECQGGADEGVEGEKSQGGEEEHVYEGNHKAVRSVGARACVEVGWTR